MPLRREEEPQERQPAADGADDDRLAQADPRARAPPAIVPIGIVPQTMNRITEFIRPCRRGGQIACR